MFVRFFSFLHEQNGNLISWRDSVELEESRVTLKRISQYANFLVFFRGNG